MSHNLTNNTVSIRANFLLVPLPIQYTFTMATLTMATLQQKAAIHLSIVITVDRQHQPSSYHLMVYITLGSHHISIPIVL